MPDIIPTLEERRDRKLALAIACLQDAFVHLEDAKPMMVADEDLYDGADKFSKKVSGILTGGASGVGLAHLAAMVKGRKL